LTKSQTGITYKLRKGYIYKKKKFKEWGPKLDKKWNKMSMEFIFKIR
jgi:hypothetical protein